MNLTSYWTLYEYQVRQHHLGDKEGDIRLLKNRPFHRISCLVHTSTKTGYVMPKLLIINLFQWTHAGYACVTMTSRLFLTGTNNSQHIASWNGKKTTECCSNGYRIADTADTTPNAIIMPESFLYLNRNSKNKHRKKFKLTLKQFKDWTQWPLKRWHTHTHTELISHHNS